MAMVNFYRDKVYGTRDEAQRIALRLNLDYDVAAAVQPAPGGTGYIVRLPGRTMTGRWFGAADGARAAGGVRAAEADGV